MGAVLRAGGLTAAAVALAVALSACGSGDSGSEATTTPGTGTTETTASTTTAAPETSTTAALPADQDLAEYVRGHGLTMTAARPGRPGVPRVDLPAPPGWADAGPQTPADAFLAYRFADPAAAKDPATITLRMWKLTGNVDKEALLAAAPVDIQRLPGFGEAGQPIRNTLGGYEAVQIGGIYRKDGSRRLIAQKSVLIPGTDAVYLLQIDAEGAEEQLPPLLEATAFIDDTASITR